MTRPRHTLRASLGVVVAVGVIALAWNGQRSHPSSATGARPAASLPPTTAVAAGQAASEHAAPDLEALLPNKVNGVALKKGSTTGAVVFGSDAFSRDMRSFLASVGKTPQDLRFANARDPSGRLDLEVGVFEVRGLAAPALAQEIVAGSLPDAPGLATSTATLSGKPVTVLAYPGGSVLYLYAHEGRVFYVGTPSESLAAGVVAMLP